MDSKTYWRKREQENLQKYQKSEKQYAKEISDIYDYMMDRCQKEIDGFYAKYARKEGITLAEAKKKASKLDMEEYSRKAKKYVEEKDFSKEANDEMRLYNMTMKVNRLELLKANIGLELVSGFDELQKYYEQVLTERTLDEFTRQAGILGKTVLNNAKAAHAIVNASFKNAKFSDRVWMYQDMMKSDLSKLLQEGLIQGRNPKKLAPHLQKRFGVSKRNAERLMITELARVQTEAQKQSFIRNGFEEYQFNALGTACGVCAALDGKHFKVADMMPGENAPPMHPRCRCSVSAYMDTQVYREWLDTYQEHGLNWQEWQKSVAKSGDSAIMKMNLQYFAKISKEKFTKYALDYEKAPDKAEAFEKALGYTKDNYEDLIDNIQNHFEQAKWKYKASNQYGKLYEYVMELVGANGKKANVCTGWILKNGEDEPSLTSAYVTKKKVTNGEKN